MPGQSCPRTWLAKPATWAVRRPITAVSQCGALGDAPRRHLARAARALRQARHSAQAGAALGAEGHLAAPVCDCAWHGAGGRAAGLDHRTGPPAGGRTSQKDVLATRRWVAAAAG